MKQIYILLIAMCAIAFTACSKDDTDDPELEGSITMCFSTENGSSLAVELETHGIGTGIIDWGDGSIPEKFDMVSKSHSYPQDGDYVITIRETGCYSLNVVQMGGVKSINVDKCTSLRKLQLGSYIVENIRISSCPNLEIIYCGNVSDWGANACPQLTLNIFACPNLQVLSCERRKLTSLNVKEFVNLKTLNCSGSQLTSLEVSGCSNLNTLDCSYNQLTALYIQGCTSLQELDCRGNKFTQESVNILCSGLPDTYGNLWIDTDKWDTTLAKVKGWTVSNEYY